MKKYQFFLSEIFQFLEVKFSIFLNRLVFVMVCQERCIDWSHISFTDPCAWQRLIQK